MPSTKDTGLMTSNMEKELKLGVNLGGPKPRTLEISLREKRMERVGLLGKMGPITKEISWMATSTEWGGITSLI